MNKQKPYFDKKQKIWKIEHDNGIEMGDILYVACEFAEVGLYYPFYINGEKHHDHYFEGVIQALIEYPTLFSIIGFEDKYSEQELQLIIKLQQKLNNI